MFVYSNSSLLEATLPTLTITSTLPLPAPEGALTLICCFEYEIIVALLEPKVTFASLALSPKFDPTMVTSVSAVPILGESDEIEGGKVAGATISLLSFLLQDVVNKNGRARRSRTKFQ